MSIGSVDCKDLKQLAQQLRELTDGQSRELDMFYEDCAKELAARLLRATIRRTPVGVYPKSSGKKGGTLRRGWTGGARNYADSLHVRREGTTYVVEITNPVKYAPYVEYGHRTANHEGWVEGVFMLSISEAELRGQMNGILQRKIAAFLKEHLDI